MNIVVVGVGALGSHVILISRNINANWTVIDFDRVETKNIMSQFHTRMSVGKNKAQSIQQIMQGLFGIKVKSVPHKLTEDNAQQLLGEADLVVDCLDNGKSRRVIQSFVRDNNIACLHGALAPNGEFGRVIWDENFAIDDEGGEGQATCENGDHLPFIINVSSYMSSAIKSFVEDNKKQGYQVYPGGLIKV